MSFSKMVIFDHAPRSAMILADTAVGCDELLREDFELLGWTHPQAKMKIFNNLCLDRSRKLHKANRELGTLD